MRLLLVLCHARAMYRGLRQPKNRRKGGWQHLDSQYLLRRLQREVVELQAALWAYEDHGGDWRQVVSEAADVSNFAAMLADNAKRGKRS